MAALLGSEAYKYGGDAWQVGLQIWQRCLAVRPTNMAALLDS
jgi:hypothetical protein